MRVAILSDIHGNSIALDAVLADLRSHGGVDAYWVLGDLVALGPDPIGVLERLDRLENASFIRGNTDRYTAMGDRPPPTLEEVAQDPSLVPRLIEVAQTDFRMFRQHILGEAITRLADQFDHSLRVAPESEIGGKILSRLPFRQGGGLFGEFL
jgi:predicted phosphodiesterase